MSSHHVASAQENAQHPYKYSKNSLHDRSNADTPPLAFPPPLLLPYP